MILWDDDDRDSRRGLSIRDKKILWRNAEGKCENPKCGKKIDFDEMQVGHKTAWSKGGRTTLANSKCLCYRCNNLQGTDSWATFLKKQGVEDPKSSERKAVKQALGTLNIGQLKLLAKKHQVKVKGEVVEEFLGSYRKAPTKTQYVKKLSGLLMREDLRSIPKEAAKAVKKRRRKDSDDSWW